MTIGQTIREVRRAYGITQKQLSEACGINDATIRKYESGKLIPKAATIEKIAKGLGVDVNILLGSNVDTPKTMINLFRAFNSYSGEIKEGRQIVEEVKQGTFDEDTIYISFKGLNALLASWHNEYQKYLQSLEKAEEILDEKEKKAYIEESSKTFQQWMAKYPESEPNKEMLEFNRIMDEANDYMGLHPLNDLDYPVSEKYKEKSKNELQSIYEKLNDFSSAQKKNTK